ncbi:putative membrane protein YkvI [Pullulanibacillus pueri]|uniref:Membrane protein YkvI n=2 Tax=Pullulanibacillus pueri TaxID=1437324 RepID=A0A8J2ZV00_9BACL|nr:hypothetical protein [Pullulanibacillus pueri]MBM7682178.1 putative membrane protein YkvI [Pullulanibacillus pueri]GGH80338.1 hypothetical protein GCM10007096_16590 [Pullulanibacillus pueri]
MVKAGLKWMFLIIGTTIGAGYASGRELWQFFGQESVFAIALFTILFILSIYVMMSIGYKMKTTHYTPILEQLVGEKIAAIYDGMIFVYLFSTTVIMIAGGGAALEAVKIPYWHGIFLMSTVLVLLFIWGNKGLVSINIVIIPLLIILLLAVLLKFGHHVEGIWKIDIYHQSNWTSAIIFTSLNILSLAAILGGIGSEIKTKGEILFASIGSGVVLGVVSFFYNQSLIQVAGDIMVYEIPLFALLKNYPYAMTIIMTVLLLFAIYTTAASGLFGLITRLKKIIKLPYWGLAALLVITMIPLTTLGFAKLVTILYPLYGLINLYILAALVIYPIVQKQQRKID